MAAGSEGNWCGGVGGCGTVERQAWAWEGSGGAQERWETGKETAATGEGDVGRAKRRSGASRRTVESVLRTIENVKDEKNLEFF